MSFDNPFRRRGALFVGAWALALWGVSATSVGCVARSSDGAREEAETRAVVADGDSTMPEPETGGDEECDEECVPVADVELSGDPTFVDTEAITFEADNGALYSFQYTADSAYVVHTSSEGDVRTFAVTAGDRAGLESLMASIAADFDPSVAQEHSDWAACALAITVLVGDLAIALLAITALILVAKLLLCAGSVAVRSALAALKNNLAALGALLAGLVAAAARRDPAALARQADQIAQKMGDIGNAIADLVTNCRLPAWLRDKLRDAWNTFRMDWSLFRTACGL